ncbi:hypothetical protein [Mycoplasma sp. SG1]|uniref:hypothetical protein n=1 Tax=Mycoplasma sp. SG1 TaxID=2810348 RepID=UPI0020256508|nr:hypothetical protein [Mycoplasma sp. SG1]URM52848.1 hypothetical protein JRW51_00685 [Mycoplasma sp. SG1]
MIFSFNKFNLKKHINLIINDFSFKNNITDPQNIDKIKNINHLINNYFYDNILINLNINNNNHFKCLTIFNFISSDILYFKFFSEYLFLFVFNENIKNIIMTFKNNEEIQKFFSIVLNNFYKNNKIILYTESDKKNIKNFLTLKKIFNVKDLSNQNKKFNDLKKIFNNK